MHDKNIFKLDKFVSNLHSELSPVPPPPQLPIIFRENQLVSFYFCLRNFIHIWRFFSRLFAGCLDNFLHWIIEEWTNEIIPQPTSLILNKGNTLINNRKQANKWSRRKYQFLSNFITVSYTEKVNFLRNIRIKLQFITS